jgi:hypothetical protein
MTNTLHRFGDAESFRDDYVVICVPSRGRNDENVVPKLKKFLEMALKYGPVNLGDSRHGGALRPSRKMNPLAHWKRDTRPDFEEVIRGLDTATTARRCSTTVRPRGVHQRCSQCRPRRERQHLDVDRRRRCNAARLPELARHSWCGVLRRIRRQDQHLPSSDVLALATMCGHGMVSTSLAKR